jgi:hypothetical protein
MHKSYSYPVIASFSRRGVKGWLVIGFQFFASNRLKLCPGKKSNDEVRKWPTFSISVVILVGLFLDKDASQFRNLRKIEASIDTASPLLEFEAPVLHLFLHQRADPDLYVG